MNRSESIGQLAAALALAQGEMENAEKDGKNPHFSSRFATLKSNVEAYRPHFSKNGLSVVQIPSTPESGLVRMVTMILHSSGEWIESDPLTVQAKDAGPQAVGSCLSYLRRYQLAALVGIAPEDDDAEAAEGRAVPSQQTARPQAPRLQPPIDRATTRPLLPPNSVPKPQAGKLTSEPVKVEDSVF